MLVIMERECLANSPTELLQGYQGEELGVTDVIVVSCYIISYHTGFTVLKLNFQNFRHTWYHFEHAHTPLSFMFHYVL